MAPRRARGCRTLRLPVLLLLLLHRPPATRGSSNSPASASPVAGITGITCPPPVSVEHADIRVKSYSLYSRERYICNSGFKRKAGTSSLTECVLNKATNIAHWTTPSLKCIMAISTSTVLLCGLSAMSLLACYIKSRVSLCHPGWSTVSCKVTTARSLNLELQQSSCLGWIQCWGYRREPLLPAKVSFLMPQFPPKTSRLIFCFLCHVNGDSAVGKSKLEKEKAQNNSADAVITQQYASAMVPV
ncbi:interleukin-15 receptor subunit alpha isoform X13 [Trachypithecus francoisi]|uniref:interleukin-15 receptor subunit alpha isoform X13 n=1 Tax=Trachypithecus francoisi TaxID=54180 RepID=UPI00141B98E5|nr:interleukin-15 receptor subunit alpha isoform X13 [Trachypithecus francoisi]